MKNARLLHYSHCVSDIERSRAFYTDVLGFETMAEFDFDDPLTAKVMMVPECKFKGIFMKCDGLRIELIGFANPPPEPAVRPRSSNEVGHSHLTFNVRDLDEALDYMREKGVPIEEGSRPKLVGGSECCVVRDPDGFPIELVHSPQLGLAPYES